MIRKSGSRSNAPAATISAGSTWNAITASRPSRCELVEVEAERAHVQGDLRRRLLEAHQHTRLAVLPGARRPGTPGRAASCPLLRRLPPASPGPGQPASGDLIQPGDSGRRFLQARAHRRSINPSALRYSCVSPDSAATGEYFWSTGTSSPYPYFGLITRNSRSEIHISRKRDHQKLPGPDGTTGTGSAIGVN